MEIISELEDEFTARRLANFQGRISLRTARQSHLLDEAKIAQDLILGRSGNRIYFFPNHSIVEVSGVAVQTPLQQTIARALSEQRQPVKLTLTCNSETQSAWLLNVEGEWLRLAGNAGVLWVPLARLLVAETDLILSGARA